MPPLVGFPQGVITALAVAMPFIPRNEERLVEEKLFRFRLANPVFIILTVVTVIPVKTGYQGEIDHVCILP